MARRAFESRLEQRDRFGKPVGGLVGHRQVIGGNQRLGVLGTEPFHAPCEHLLEEGDGFLELAALPVGIGQVALDFERVGIAGPRLCHGALEVSLVKCDGFGELAGGLVGDRQVLHGGQGVEMIEAERKGAEHHRPLVLTDRQFRLAEVEVGAPRASRMDASTVGWAAKSAMILGSAASRASRIVTLGPRPALFEVAQFESCPEGAKHISPGQRPGDRPRIRIDQALKGCNTIRPPGFCPSRLRRGPLGCRGRFCPYRA